jgi:hypothetical protein
MRLRAKFEPPSAARDASFCTTAPGAASMTTSVFTRPSCFAIVAGSTTVSGFGAGVTGARSSLVQAQYERPDAPLATTRRVLATNSRGPAADDPIFLVLLLSHF